MILIKSLQKNQEANIDPGKWIYVILMVVVLIMIVAALFPTLTTALASYNTSSPTFGAILQTVVPLVIGAAILIAVVLGLLAMAKGHEL